MGQSIEICRSCRRELRTPERWVALFTYEENRVGD